jgi:Cupredoxin-like domain
MLNSKLLATATISAIWLCFAGMARADEPAQINFQDQRFTPQVLNIPAGHPSAIRVTNSSNETIEFESFKLNREKALTPGQTIIVQIPALTPGSYDFYDDFHQDVPEGAIVAK